MVSDHKYHVSGYISSSIPLLLCTIRDCLFMIWSMDMRWIVCIYRIFVVIYHLLVRSIFTTSISRVMPFPHSHLYFISSLFDDVDRIISHPHHL